MPSKRTTDFPERNYYIALSEIVNNSQQDVEWELETHGKAVNQRQRFYSWRSLLRGETNSAQLRNEPDASRLAQILTFTENVIVQLAPHSSKLVFHYRPPATTQTDYELESILLQHREYLSPETQALLTSSLENDPLSDLIEDEDDNEENGNSTM